jgi:predicted regulator of Ras-like GTPase activity (Roadblock/LC7/MglB family)
MTKKRKEAQGITALAEPIAIEETTPARNIRACLEEINEYEGVAGYILRNTTSASIDLKDPSKIIDFAILSSASIDAGKELSELFDLGSVNHIVVEGKNVKMLSLVAEENRISVFMERDADTEKVLRKLCAP